MKSVRTPSFRFAHLAFALAGALGMALIAQGAVTDLADEPLAQPASNVKPNLMFILDDSGSMAQDYTPDSVNDSLDTSNTPPTTTASCFGSITGATPGNPQACTNGDPPFSAPDFNTQYYNADIFFRPGANYDGTDMTNQNCANTGGTVVGATCPGGWTSVQTDPYRSPSNTTDLTSFNDRMWCNSSSDTATSTFPAHAASGSQDSSSNRALYSDDGGSGATGPYTGVVPGAYAGSPKCVLNNDYQYPDAVFSKSISTSGNPYYYRIAPTEYCSDTELTNCTAATAPTGSFTFPALVRNCTDTTYSSCQRKKLPPFLYPKYLGTVTTVPSRPAVYAQGSITFGTTPNAASVNLLGMTIGGTQVFKSTFSHSYSNGVSVTNGVITAANGLDSTIKQTQFALAVRDTINASNLSYKASIGLPPGAYGLATAPVVGSNPADTTPANSVTITYLTATSSVNNNAFLTTSTVTYTAATAQFTINNTSSNSNASFNSVSVKPIGGTSSNIMNTALSSSSDCKLTDNSTNRNTCAAKVAASINAATGTNGGYTATASNNVVTVTAPNNTGAANNGFTITESYNRGTVSNTAFTCSDGSAATAGQLSCGVTAGAPVISSQSMIRGTVAITVSTKVRSGVGNFNRTDIVPTNDSYPKASARIDCTTFGDHCTFIEEMTNFANWYAYYRTRILMIKSAAGRAFVPMDDTYRVGFITINPGSTVSSSKYLKIADFTAGSGGQKQLWYNKFYSQNTGNSTPLREALSRIGQLYAGKIGSSYLTNGIPAADDPVTVSCQPNFALLSTDGYWNGPGGADLNDASLDSTDLDGASNSGLTKQSDGVFDANKAQGTLADVAQYYYQTDLRPTGSKNNAGVDVSTNNVPQTQLDTVSFQHMVTFTLGLGLDGELSYRSDYSDPGLTTGDFFAIKQGTKRWPVPVHDAPSALDDLWHAAVNGRGLFFSAKNPQELSTSLGDTLAAMRARVGAGAAAATSNLQPVAGDNFAFTAQYQTETWIGDLKARTIDLNSGIVSSAVLWAAGALLDQKSPDTRTIYTLDAGDTTVATGPPATNGNKLKNFCWPGTSGTACADGAGLTSSEQAFFNPNQLAQYNGWSPSQKSAATASMVVNFIRGDTTNEDTGFLLDTDLFRQRQSLLGDIVSAQPAYVKVSPFAYTDNGYADFQACTAGTFSGTCPSAQFASSSVRRKPTVFVAANDGMLHALETDVNNSPYFQTGGISTPATTDDTYSSGNNAGNGVERWAYTPGLTMSRLYKLANNPYSHFYNTDGSPVVGDICITMGCTNGLADWRTILVAGLNNGGRGYYALDITHPDKPNGLWEFGVSATCIPSGSVGSTSPFAVTGTFSGDCNVGDSFGNPIITKRQSDGKWVVIVTSGLNNVSPGNGKGYLYVLDAVTGSVLNRIPTGVGCDGVSTVSPCVSGTVDPSGLGRINNWVDDGLHNNTTLAVYGGDLKGNMWRFDFDSTRTSTFMTATRIAAVNDGATTPAAQPITVKPELGLINTKRVIFFGTGKFLGTSDTSTTQTQTVYAISDDMSGNTAVSGRTNLIGQTLNTITSGTNAGSRTPATLNTVDWVANRGWFVDLPDSGERVNVDPQLQLGTLVVASNVPNTDACSAGGYSWLNSFDYKTGGYIGAGTSASPVSTKIAGSLIVGLNIIELPGGKISGIITTADNQQLTVPPPVTPTVFTGGRMTWRELIFDR